LRSKNIKIKIYRTAILPVALYGCETWSLTLREEHRLRVFENRVLRKIYWPKRNKVAGVEKTTEQMIKSRRKRWTGHVACMGDRRGAYRVLMGTPNRKRQLVRPRHRWEDNIKMNL
jgi:hypothetical protein